MSVIAFCTRSLLWSTYNPRSQPNPTRLEVVAASTYVTHSPEKSVKAGERDEIKTTIAEKPIAIPAATIAVRSIDLLVSYHQNAPDV
jgi:hypothetical protein